MTKSKIAEWVEGKFGTAVHLPAAGDYVEVPHSDSLDIKQDITMEIWAKVDSISSDPYCSFVTKCTADNVGAYMLRVDPKDLLTTTWGQIKTRL